MKHFILFFISCLLAVSVNGQAVVRFGTPSTTLGVTSVPIIFDSIPTPLTSFYLKGNYNHIIYDFIGSEQADSLTMAGGLGIVNIICQLGDITIAWANAFHPTILNDTIFILKFSNSSSSCDDFIWDITTPGSQCSLSNINPIPATFEDYLCIITASDDAVHLGENSTINLFADHQSVVIESKENGRAYVIDMMGRVVVERPIEKGQNYFKVNEPGVYIVKVRISKSVETSIKLLVL